jgi:hypothetical protein
VIQHPVSDEIAAALGAFVAGGAGPRHSSLTRVFGRCGYGSAAPYVPNSQLPQLNKEDRVRETVAAAVRDPHRSRELVDGLLAEYRVAGFFKPSSDRETERQRQERVTAARAAFARVDWELSQDGELRPAGVGTVTSAQGRPAIEEQLARLRRATNDPALLLGTAKEMLESTAKYVMEEFSVPYSSRMDYEELWFHARDRLGLNPRDIDVTQPGAQQVREILQASLSIAKVANEIRNIQGTGHGRTLPTAMTPELALLVVREACSVVEMVLSTLDRSLGH